MSSGRGYCGTSRRNSLPLPFQLVEAKRCRSTRRHLCGRGGSPARQPVDDRLMQFCPAQRRPLPGQNRPASRISPSFVEEGACRRHSLCAGQCPARAREWLSSLSGSQRPSSIIRILEIPLRSAIFGAQERPKKLVWRASIWWGILYRNLDALSPVWFSAVSFCLA